MSSRKERMFRSYCRQLHGVGIKDTPIRDTPALLFVCAAQNAFKKGMRSTRQKKRRYALGGPHCENGRLKKHTHTQGLLPVRRSSVSFSWTSAASPGSVVAALPPRRSRPLASALPCIPFPTRIKKQWMRKKTT